MAKFLWSNLDETAPTVIMGVPLDETTSFRPGARFGPSAAREASQALEDYSLRQRRTLDPKLYYDAGDLVLPMGNVEEALEVIKRAAGEILSRDKNFLALGGEHLITLPLVEAVAQRHPELVVIHLDAHADLRSRFTGTRYSHGTVMRRVAELLGPGRVYQLGVRSADRGELEETRGLTEIHFYKVLEPLRTVVSKLDSRPVYLTVDIDVVDPAFAPGTGVPEPGGITSQELLDAVASLQGTNVIAADLVEVAPAYDSTGQTGLLAASIVRECLLLLSHEKDAGLKGK
ncbi:MAG TPA: agmatinase [Firmicutes bacterium]|nr:agmatinase [Candidatus Fermentithermobacillaceae bacterium]